MFGKDKPENIRKEKVTKKVSVKDSEIRVTVDKVMAADIKGKKEILDEQMIDNMIDGIAAAVAANRTKYNPLPTEIIIKTNGEETEEKAAENSSAQKAELYESYDPRYSLDQVVLNSSVKDKISTAISAVRHRSFLSENWGLAEHFGSGRAVILNFYGKPGTGKSMAAEAVAKALDKKVYHINYAELESKYVGETPKNIKKAFAKATEDDALLIFDEADSFLGKRLTSVTQSADYGVNITRSVLLMELERFTGVVIFTTNLIKNYDEAFKRRILLSVYFEMPDEESRKEIWKLHIGEKLPLAGDITPEILAKKYDELSGADIKDMVFYSALNTLEREAESVSSDDMDKAYEVIKERYKDRSKEQEVKILKTEKITEEQYLKETGGNSDNA